MKRRGFFGFAAGAAVAGPGMVKQAAAQSLSDLEIPSLGPSFPPIGGYGAAVGQGGDRSWVQDKWRAFQALINSTETLRRRKREMGIHQLDPDIAASRSFSLDAKIRMQRERNFKAWLEREQGWFTRNWDSDDETSRWY